MKQFRFLSVLCCAGTILFFTSCNNSSEEQANTDTSGDSAANAAGTPASTIVTTPQHMMVAKHKVSNFEKWMAGFEGHDSVRLANGIHKYVIGRGVDDSNMVLVAVKVDDIAKAKAFSKGASLKTAMQKSGVTGTPTIMLHTAVFQDTATISSPIRSMTTFTVKDWDTWKKSFESRKQLRIDNGLADRVYGYDADDNHKVMLVVAVNDTAKARAYWNSDLIKKNREESGVTSPVERFVFRVVKRY